MKTIGEALQSTRARMGLRVRDMAHMVDADQAQMSKWLHSQLEPGPTARRRFHEAKLLSAEEALLPFRNDEAAA